VIEVDRISLRLPPSYAHRADAIARALAAALAPLEAIGPAAIERLAVAAPPFDPAASDQEIGRVLAGEVMRGARARRR
jgi:hypothetical protein